MRTMGMLIACSLLAAGTSALPVKTNAVLEPGTDLSGFRSYVWSGKPTSTNPLGRERIVNDIDAELRVKGWIEAGDADVADLSVVAKVETSQKQSTDTFYSQGATRGWGLRPGSSGRIDSPRPPKTTVHINKIGTLTVEMLDTRTHRALWHASAVIDVSESTERTNAAIDAGIAKLFSGFPSVASH